MFSFLLLLQTNKQTNKQTKKQTNKQTNKQKSLTELLICLKSYTIQFTQKYPRKIKSRPFAFEYLLSSLVFHSSQPKIFVVHPSNSYNMRTTLQYSFVSLFSSVGGELLKFCINTRPVPSPESKSFPCYYYCGLI